jgi:hypothetical protein
MAQLAAGVPQRDADAERREELPVGDHGAGEEQDAEADHERVLFAAVGHCAILSFTTDGTPPNDDGPSLGCCFPVVTTVSQLAAIALDSHRHSSTLSRRSGAFR